MEKFTSNCVTELNLDHHLDILQRCSIIVPFQFSFTDAQCLVCVCVCVYRELSRNRVRRVEGLTFQGLHALRSLKMQRNSLTRLMDGAFWGLSNMEVL